MEYFIHNISEELLYALGWTVVHSLWQAMLVAIIMAIISLGLQKQTARVRYLAANAGLLSVLAMAVITFNQLYAGVKESGLEEILLIAAPTTAIVPTETTLLQEIALSFSTYFNAHLPLIVTIWLVGVAFFTLRLIGGLAYVQHLKNRYVYPLSDQWQDLLNELARQVPVTRSVQLMESALTKMPMVVGFIKPVILLPVGAINGLTTVQVEAILAHELAHIYRNDYLLNIFQSIVEILFYFNPAVWWISANIRTERENCCDDIAVELCGNSLTYAKALVSLQEISQTSPRMAMTFSSSKNQLLNRVKRILNQPQNKSNIMEKLTATCMLLLAILVLSISANRPYDNQADATEPEILETAPLIELDVSTKIHLDQPHALIDLKITDKELESHTVTIEEIVEDRYFPPLDTLPKGKIHVEVTRQGQKIDAKIRDRKITYLKIDDEEIPADEYGDYELMLEEIMADIPEPPVPPIAPVPPVPTIPSEPNLPATPPIPPSPEMPAEPPLPPAPPTPPAPGKYFFKSKTISTDKDSDGNTIIILKTDGEEPLELKINAKDQVVFLDGEPIEQGEKALIIDESKRPFVYELKGDYLTPLVDDLSWTGEIGSFDQKNLDAWVDISKNFTFELDSNVVFLNKKMNHWIGEDGLNFTMPQIDDSSNYSFFGNGDFGIVNKNLQSNFEAEMLADGLISDAKKYKFEITKEKLVINGQKQPAATHKKYLNIYKSSTGYELGGNSRIVLNKNGESKDHYFKQRREE